MSIAAKKNTFLADKYCRLARNGGMKKAIVAIERTLLRRRGIEAQWDEAKAHDGLVHRRPDRPRC